MLKGANNKIVRNVTVFSAFWAAIAFMVSSANAQGIYDNTPVKTVSTTSGMNPGTVPQATVEVDSTGTGVEGNNEGNANTGGVQVQNVTVQATAGADAQAKSDAMSSVDNISKMRSDTEQTHNALLLQKLELERLKAEQKRLDGIQKFDPNGTEVTHTPCGAGPCVPVQPVAPPVAQPLIENNNSNSVIVNPVQSSAIEEIEEAPSAGTGMKFALSPVAGYRWFTKNSFYDIDNNFIVGATASTILSSTNSYWIGLDASFIYGEDRISHPLSFVNSDTTRDSYEFSLGGRIGPRWNSIFKPWASVGLGYLKQDYNDLRSSTCFTCATTDESTASFEVNAGVGFNVEISKNFSLGAQGDYQFVMNSEREGWSEAYGDNSDRYRLGGGATWTF